jgi:outer membrane protein, adhesin transport system
MRDSDKRIKTNQASVYSLSAFATLSALGLCASMGLATAQTGYSISGKTNTAVQVRMRGGAGQVPPSATAVVLAPLSVESAPMSAVPPSALVPMLQLTPKQQSMPILIPAMSSSTVGSDYLSSLVELAVTTHPSVQSKTTEVMGAKASTDAAKWQYYPTPSVIAERGANQTKKDVGTATNAAVTGTTTLRLQQPLWSGGRIGASVRVAELKTLAAQAGVNESRLSVALKTVDAWQSLLLAYGREQVASKSAVQLAQLLGMMERRVAQQVSPPVEAELSQSRLVQAQADVISAKAAKDSALHRLEQWVGDLAIARVGANQQLTQLPLTDMVLAQALREGGGVLAADMDKNIADAIEQHPSLLRYEYDVAVAKQEVELKRAEQFPTLYARVDRQMSDNANLYSTGRAINTLAYLGLEYSLGAGLSQRSAVDVLLAKMQGMQSERETVRRDIKDRYESEWRDYQSALQRVAQADKVQRTSAALLASYERLFVAGRRSWLELLNAVRELSSAEQMQNDLQAQLHASAYRLRLYLGELSWQHNNQ